MKARDPRIDPKRGDMTRSSCGTVYRILAASKGKVKWREEADGFTAIDTLHDWRAWAALDDVVKVSGSEENSKDPRYTITDKGRAILKGEG